MTQSAALSARVEPGMTKMFAGVSSSDRGTRLVAYVLAALAHLGFAFAATSMPKRAPEITHVTEVELAPPPEPPPPPPPPPETKEPEPPVPEEKAPVAAKAPPATNTPQVARAGNVVTAKEDPAKADDSEAVTFVTDPDGKSFGSGVVARGGTLDHADGPLRPAPTAPPAPKAGPPASGGDAITPAANLSRAARLEDSDPCAGRYPATAKVDDGFATIALVVRADGRVLSASVVSENPAGEGFGAAARECLKNKTLSPARNKAGDAVNAAATIRVRFSR